MSLSGLLSEVLESHRRLPRILRVWAFLPLTLAFVIAAGLTFTLPPGPLCDEGMVLFMEGGCDYGGSNIFFFSKLGLLVAANLALVVAARKPDSAPLGFVPHLSALFALAIPLLEDRECDTYYSHPNGSMGQMIMEIIAFAVLGLTLLGWLQRRSSAWLAIALPIWNVAYIAVFYAWLWVTPHWTWLHTALIVASLLLISAAWRLTTRSSGRASAPVARFAR